MPGAGPQGRAGPRSRPEMWGAVGTPRLLPAAWLLALHAGRGGWHRLHRAAFRSFFFRRNGVGRNVMGDLFGDG